MWNGYLVKKERKFIEDFKNWLINRDSTEKVTEAELIRYYETRTGKGDLELETFLNVARREVLILEASVDEEEDQ